MADPVTLLSIAKAVGAFLVSKTALAVAAKAVAAVALAQSSWRPAPSGSQGGGIDREANKINVRQAVQPARYHLRHRRGRAGSLVYRPASRASSLYVVYALSKGECDAIDQDLWIDGQAAWSWRPRRAPGFRFGAGSFQSCSSST